MSKKKIFSQKVVLLATFILVVLIFFLVRDLLTKNLKYINDKYGYTLLIPKTWSATYQHPVQGLNDHIRGIPDNGEILDHEVFYKKPASIIYAFGITQIANPQKLSLTDWSNEYQLPITDPRSSKEIHLPDDGVIKNQEAEKIEVVAPNLDEIIYIIVHQNLIYTIEYSKKGEAETVPILKTLQFN